jgi:hypothetical protein
MALQEWMVGSSYLLVSTQLKSSKSAHIFAVVLVGSKKSHDLAGGLEKIFLANLVMKVTQIKDMLVEIMNRIVNLYFFFHLFFHIFSLTHLASIRDFMGSICKRRSKTKLLVHPLFSICYIGI